MAPLYELLAGQPAFVGTVAEILDAKQRMEHLSLDGEDPRIVELIVRTTSRDPGVRPKTALALPAFAPLAAEVAARAHAIHDALYGEHREPAGDSPTTFTPA